MSQKIIQICDRCGQEYSLKTRTWGWLQSGKFVRYCNSDIEYGRNQEYDLCEACMKDFHSFMHPDVPCP